MADTAIISSKGQVTIPKKIREDMNLRKNDRLLFTSVGKKLIVVKPLKRSFLDFGGSVSPRQKPEDLRAVRRKVMSKVAQNALFH